MEAARPGTPGAVDTTAVSVVGVAVIVTEIVTGDAMLETAVWTSTAATAAEVVSAHGVVNVPEPVANALVSGPVLVDRASATHVFGPGAAVTAT